MTTSPDTKWQFSLRSLFVFTFACAVIAGLWKLLGTKTLVAAAFVPVSLLPVFKMSGRQRAAYAVSWFTIYGPFIVMATYTLLYISCSHCKQTTWQVLPYGPGVIPVMFVWYGLGLPQDSHVLQIVLPAIVAAGMVAGLTWLLQRGRPWWKVLCVTVGLLTSAYFAFVLLAIIQA